MKAIWSGGIAFGLVNIPIKLYSVAQREVLGFRMLCGKCKTPIEMKRWCPHCKKDVTWNNVLKGFELSKGHYFVLTQDALRALKPEKTDTVNIIAFVDAYRVDPVYFDAHYYAAPGQAQQAYTLFSHALGASDKVAIGQFVMRDRSHLCMIQNYHTGLLLTTLHYAYEVRPVDKIAEFNKKEAPVTSAELKLAQQLIAQLTKKSFDITIYKDTFAQELKEAIKKKSGGKIVSIAQEQKKESSRRVKKEPSALMDVLRASLGAKKPTAARAKAARSASTRSRKPTKAKPSAKKSKTIKRSKKR
jgi:DNA end-binding protein Ku